MRGVHPWLAVLPALACCLFCHGRSVPRNVLLVSLDTVRADRLGCYGRADAGTPVLDALAARGVRFADVTAPNPTTLPSHVSLFTGQDVPRHGVRNNGMFAVATETVTLAERFAGAGFRTGGFVASMVLDRRYGIARGFERYTAPGRDDANGPLYVPERPAAEVNRDALAWLDSIGTDRFFLFVHYMEAHVPYAPPEPERSRFAHEPYQGEIAAADRALGELFAALERRERLADTLVLVVADHGEALGEHGEPNHGIFLYQPTLHVPMIAAGPGVRRGSAVETPVSLVDATPTLLDAVGLAAPDPCDGQSLWPALGGARLDPQRALYSETYLPRYDYGWSELRALRKGAFKYVRAPRPELYRLDRDPQESHDLSASERETAESLAAELAARLTRIEHGEAERVEISAEERKALAGLGYLAGSGEPSPGAPLPDPKERIGEVAALAADEGLIHAGRYAEAERALRSVIAERPSYLNERTRLVWVLAEQGQVEAAIDAVRALDDVARRMPDGARFAAPAHLVLGRLYLDQDRPGDAVREYEAALAAPQPSEVYDLLAAIYHDLGRREDAIHLLRDLAARGEASPRSLRMLDALETSAAFPSR